MRPTEQFSHRLLLHLDGQEEGFSYRLSFYRHGLRCLESLLLHEYSWFLFYHTEPLMSFWFFGRDKSKFIALRPCDP